MDDIYNLYNVYNGKINIEQIQEALVKLNNYYSNQQMCKPHSTYKQHVIDKCTKSGLWLFINRNLQIEHIEKILN